MPSWHQIIGRQTLDAANVLYLKGNGANNAVADLDSAKGGTAPHTMAFAGGALIRNDGTAGPFGEMNGFYLLPGTTGGNIQLAGFGDLDVTQNFTIDWWANRIANPTGTRQYFLLRQNASNFVSVYRLTGFIPGTTCEVVQDGVTQFALLAGGQPAAGAWGHFAITREGAAMYFWLNGILAATFFGAGGSVSPISGTIYIGTNNAGAAAFNYRLAYLRFTNGLARYLSAVGTYAVPARPFNAYNPNF